MTFSARLRIFLILTAVVPLLVICWIIYSGTLVHLETAELQDVRNKVSLYNSEMGRQESKFNQQLTNLAESKEFISALTELKQTGRIRKFPSVALYQFDQMEIFDSSFKVLASFNRPSKIGSAVNQYESFDQLIRTLEFDIDGSHASRSIIKKIAPNLFLIAGQYIDKTSLQHLSKLLDADLSLVTTVDSLRLFASLETSKIYRTSSGFRAVVEGASQSDYMIVASFSESDFRPEVNSLIGKAALVGLVAAIIAILFGFWLTGQSKREVDNLLVATTKISEGDFDSPIMAYQEGEFSRLADGLTEMTTNLKRAQRELATSEKIAAWQIVGRKIAHEIKNPLTPIAISAEDLRRSYHEKLDGFDSILNETTSMIQTEVTRLSKILDEFVGFARMRPPTLETIETNKIIESLNQLYRSEIESGTLLIEHKYSIGKIRADADLLKQVLVNLIKNGFESDQANKVKLYLQKTENTLVFKIEDNGSGFSSDLLTNSFEPYSSSKPDGSGLGLVICHRIIRDHGGLLELYNHENGGGVLITLPQ